MLGHTYNNKNQAMGILLIELQLKIHVTVPVLQYVS